MANSKVFAVMSLLLVGAAVAAEGKGGGDGRPGVFVHIENRGVVLPEIVGGAREQLEHVFDAAGVGVESSAEPDHDRCANQFTIHVVILGGSNADRFTERERVNRKVLAQASSEARRVYVFWDRVGPAVDGQAIPRDDALGIVLAHELGHVLLPGRGHSPHGIMQANYNAYLSYGLKFTAEEGAVMRAYVAARM